MTPFIERYGKYLRKNVARIDPKIWVIASIIAAAAMASIVFLLLLVINPILAKMHIETAILSVFPFVLGIVTLDIMLCYPYIKEMNRIEEIENTLPDALKQMADTLKSGGTYEYALREISSSDYGALTKEIGNVLRKLEEGGNFENSLKSLSENVDSRLVQRSVTIIIDSIKAGAGLADALEEIADDIRELHHIKIERKTRTMMGFLFILFAGAIVAPAIFGLVSTIISFLITTVSNSGVATVEKIKESLETKDRLLLLMEIYIFIEVVATSAIISLMREGKINKTFIYAPILLFLAYISMTIATIVSSIIIRGI